MTDEIQAPPPPAPEPRPGSTPFGAGVPVEPVEAVRLSPSERRGPSIEVQAQATPWTPPVASTPFVTPAMPVQPAAAPAPSAAAPARSAAAAYESPVPPPYSAGAYASSPSAGSAAFASAAPAYGSPPPAAPISPAAAKAASRSRWWVALCHLSYLIPLHLPGLIFTTLVWVWRRNRDPLIADQGREALNMQLTYWLAILLLTVTVFAWPLIPFVWFLGAVLSVLAAIAASNGERYRYPFILRILA